MPDALQLGPRRALMVEVVRACGIYFRIEPEAIRGARQEMRTSHARHLAMYLCRYGFANPEQGTTPDRSFAEVGHYFRRDHTTVLAACARIETDRVHVEPKGDARAANTATDLAAVRTLLAKIVENGDGVQLRLLGFPLDLCKGCEELRAQVESLQAQLDATRAKLNERK